MKTPEEFLDEAAFNHVVVNSFSFALHSFSREGEYQSTIEKISKEAMIAFAKYCCERQRESDHEVNRAYHVDKGNSFNPFPVKNNTLITDEL